MAAIWSPEVLNTVTSKQFIRISDLGRDEYFRKWMCQKSSLSLQRRVVGFYVCGRDARVPRGFGLIVFIEELFLVGFWGFFGYFFEDSAEVDDVAVAAAFGDFVEGQVVILQEEFGPVDPHVVYIITELHIAAGFEYPGQVIGADAVMFGDGAARDVMLEILLDIDADILKQEAGA